MGDRIEPSELSQEEIVDEIDRLACHTGYTCDSRGTEARRRDEKRIEALKAELDGEYEHDPDSCDQCEVEAQLLATSEGDDE
ncbi:hypothetical protein HUG10_20705 (plasmid) [Halorarum halophilum]|uniref:Uncharacterized protein n=1 Tax=Halorarum halophilum TaxID=2743090 RepID=A0A7D5H016_9EURY|nr:hypothetical protein [Halobaculum halophilum]QLG30029.1 hypothetical protein HUG10_20705 [Halobaculum halophilum]